MDRRRILLVVAVLVAALGAVLVFLYVQGADKRAEDRFDSVDVLKANAVIAPGETIEDAQAAGKLVIAGVSAEQVLAGAQTDTAALAGTKALVTIYPGEQIISDKFGTGAVASSTLQIPDKQIAISVNLTDTARVAGFVNPGSEVAIFLSGADAKTGQPFTRLLLSRVVVIGVGSTTPVSTTTVDETGAQTTEQLPRTLMTLALDQKDSERVLFAQGNGELAFALLTETSKVDPSGPTTADDLFE
ncbi:Flp pilus assembly protein CpaB [Nocardioides sp.]|uniref:Flp pilus assembly protein CpaB n=1 Tax=Nocardioides sp. TaxID=35761 RepID=UPI003562786C